MIIKDTVLLTIEMNAIMTIMISKQTIHNQDQVASYTLHIFDFSISLIDCQSMWPLEQVTKSPLSHLS